MVATEGWLDTSEVHYLELAKRMEGIGVRYLIYTDISRDGALSGVNLEQLGALNRAVSCEIIASGGVSGLADVEACKSLGLYGVICGKAVYTGALPLESAIEMAGDQRCQQNESSPVWMYGTERWSRGSILLGFGRSATRSNAPLRMTGRAQMRSPSLTLLRPMRDAGRCLTWYEKPPGMSLSR